MMMMVMVTSVLPEEADLAKSSKELWVAKVVGVVEDNRGHLYRKSECNAWRRKNRSPEWTTRHLEGSEFAPLCARGQSGLRALPR